MITTPVIAALAFGLLVGAFLGFVLCAILSMSREDKSR